MKTDAAGYETLYIYEIAGRFPAPEAEFGPGFIGAWEEDDYSFLFFGVESRARVERAVAAEGLELRSETVMPYSDWEAGDKIRPILAGKFFVYPHWLDPAVPKGSIPIRLDPGVVFGSGFHPTTRSCLLLLSELVDLGPMPDSVLDLGAGTGILALAAAAAGAKQVLAVEMNNLAAATARRNAALNRLEDRVRVVQARAQDQPRGHWGLVIANLTYPVLSELARGPVPASAGTVIISGLRVGEAPKLAPLLQAAGLRPARALEQDGWFTARLVRFDARGPVS